MPASLIWRPVFRVALDDEEYLRRAGQVGLPEITQQIESKFWKFTRRKPELKLWEKESVGLVKNDLWVNLGVCARAHNRKELGQTFEEIKWAFQYQMTIKHAYGLTSTSTPPTPIPRSGVGEGSSTKNWSLRCTNIRLVSFRECHIDEDPRSCEGHFVINFPWSMLAHIGFESYDTEFLGLGKTKHFIKLLFFLGQRRHLFVFGPIYFNDAVGDIHTIHRLALEAKIKWLQSVMEGAPPNMESKVREKLSGLQRELKSKSPEQTNVRGEKPVVSTNQTCFPSLNPFEYYQIMRKTTVEQHR